MRRAGQGVSCATDSQVGAVANPRTAELYQAVSLDHIQPKARGGKNRLANFKIAHKGCNGVRKTAPVEVARPIVKWYRAGWISGAEASDLLWRARNARTRN
jgi:5-methylcytosine-specific restriction endonuclease McrA